MMIVDAHLDLSYNAAQGRDLTQVAARQKPLEYGTASVSIPELIAGQVGMVCGVIFCQPKHLVYPGYETPEQAKELGLKQRAWYEQMQSDGHLKFVRTPADVPASPASPGEPLPMVLLLEGADPILASSELDDWYARGLRVIGLAWRRTRFAGGTGEPAGLSDEGIELIHAMDQRGILHDASHLAELAFWQLLDQTDRPVLASHSNCRSLVPGDRQLSDAMIRSIAARGGVIGINFFYKFLIPESVHAGRGATLDDMIEHVKHIADLTGSSRHVGLGTDMDGGLGAESIPGEIRTSADLPRVTQALSNAGFSDDDVRAVVGENWLDYFRRNLPAA